MFASPPPDLDAARDFVHRVARAAAETERLLIASDLAMLEVERNLLIAQVRRNSSEVISVDESSPSGLQVQ